MSLDVVSVGAWATFDRMLHLAGELEDGATVSVFADPNPDEVYFGDCSFNVAVVASSLGVTAGVVSIVGADFDASGYRGHLEKLGVDLSGVVVCKDTGSGWNLNISTPSGGSYCISLVDAARKQSEYAIPEVAIRDARFVVINEAFTPFTLRAALLGRESGATVVINGMVASAGKAAIDFLGSADIVITNRAEADDLERLASVPVPWPPARVVTNGSAGATIFQGKSEWHVPAVRASSVVDATGAGDAFVAGVVAALAGGSPLADAAAIGASTASFIVEGIGCQTNLPSWEDVIQRLGEV